MGVHAAIGYAMPWDTFWEYQTFGLKLEKYNYFMDDLSEAWADIGPIIPPPEMLFHQPPRAVIPKGEELTDLIHVVGAYDDRDHVLFLPSFEEINWLRYNDPIDRSLHRRREADQWEFISHSQYLVYGLPGYQTLFMNPDIGIAELYMEPPDGYVPAVPPILRYWLIETGLFDNQGVNQLRPMSAVWWG